MSHLSKKIAALPPEKLAEFAKKLAATGKTPSESSWSFQARKPGETTFPLSFEQQRLWFLQQLSPDTSAYNIVNFLPIMGTADLAAAEKALSLVIARHEVFRTTFHQDGDQPFLKVHPPEPVQLQLLDYAHLPEAEMETLASDKVLEASVAPFDLAKGPLLRSFLIQGADRFFWVFSYHHLVTDWWSARIFYNEVMTYYEAFKAGQTPAPTPLQWHYADYAKAQRAKFTDAVLEEHLAWWRTRLGETPPELELPTNRPRQHARDAKAAKVRRDLDAKVVARLKAFNRSEGTTTFMTLMAAVKAFLARITDAREIVLGSASANRDLDEIQDVVGLFVNTLIFHTHLNLDHSFEDLAKQVKQTCLDVYPRAALPFEKLVAALQPNRSLDRNPLFQVMYNLEKDFAIADVEEKKEGTKDLDVDAKFDLMVQVIEKPEKLTIEFEYNTGLFDKATMQHWLECLLELLSDGLIHPSKSLSHLNLLPEEARRQMLETWNQTALPFPSDQTLHALFAQQAAQRPQDLAAVFVDANRNEVALSYGDLNQAANGFAERLLQEQVRPGDTVGLLGKTSPEFLAAILGILKVGAAYVPLDPAFPAARLQRMLADANTQHLFVHADVAPAFDQPSFAIHTLQLERGNKSFANPEIEVAAEFPAYVMFTSGSTGVPKGVVIPHRAVTRLVFNQSPLVLQPGQRVAQLANLAFDATTYELWLPLVHGGTMVCLTREDSTDPARLAAQLAHYQIDSMFITTALFNRVVTQAPDAFAQVGHVLFGGEAIDETMALTAVASNPQTRFFHVYGPTECTTFATQYAFHEAGDIETPIPIGKPIGNTTAFILDGNLQPVPRGADGELYLGGPGVALGYVNQPELSQERFIPSPFPEICTGTLYKTGDVVHWQETGNIRFVGRRDHQVKIRGFRIEPDEITAHLKRLPQVADALVTVFEKDGEKDLAAYVVMNAESEWQPTLLREQLSEQLSPYMLPKSWIHLTTMPLGPTGKIDRKALPAADPNHRLRQERKIPPRNHTEQRVAQMFQTLLGENDLGIHEDFFLLGGHSLLATQVVSQIRADFGVSLNLRTFFQGPTIAQLAAAIDAQPSDAEHFSSIQPCDRSKPMPLSFAQQRLWFLNQLEPESTAYNMSETLPLAEAVNAEALEKAFTSLVQRHESLRTRFVEVDGEPAQVVESSLTFKLGHNDLSNQNKDEKSKNIQALLNQWGNQLFSLSQGPLLRAHLVKLEEDDFLLFFSMHHIISDGWSMRIFTQELFALYQGYKTRTPVALPKLAIQYADYAQWQRRMLQGQALEAQMAFWRAQLSGELPVLDLPGDYPRPAVQSFEGGLLTAHLSKQVSQKVKAFADSQGATLYQTLLAAFYALLHRYTGSDDLIVGSPVANRTRVEVEPIIGFFVNNLVLRVQLEEKITFQSLLQQVRERTLAAFDYQDTPFEMLVDAFQTKRDLSRTPLFQVLFDFHTGMNARDVSMSDRDVQIDTAICDLSLSAFETEDTLVLGAQYASALFEPETIQRMLGHYEVLLDQALTHPNQALGSLDMLLPQEQQLLLVDWNRTDQILPYQPVTRAFEDQASASPGATALVVDGEPITYAQLNTRANQWAHRLRKQGFGLGNTLGIMLPAGYDAITAVLAVMKIGARYLPLDPGYPSERLAYLMADAGVEKVLTHRNIAANLLTDTAEPLFVEEATWSELTANLEIQPPLEAAAYIMYTSGSTARPKGVVIGHRALAGYVDATVSCFELTPSDRVLQFASLSFDVAVAEIFPTLIAGATLVIQSNLKHLDYDQFTQMVADQNITGFELPTHYWSEWMAALNASQASLPDCLRYCAIGTERVKPDRLAIWQGFGRQLFHVYGLTEVTVTSIVNRVADSRTTYQEGCILPIGVPQANTQAFVLDATGALLPVGVPGELYLASSGLAFGYHAQPGMTASRFVPNPFAQADSVATHRGSGSRLYRTGDQVRWLANGQLEFLGRIDHQVKIRGYRIEPSEIEEVLRQHSALADAVVIVRATAGGSKRLIAYLVPYENQAKPNVSELRRHISELLPEFMVPEAFVFLQKLPVTHNGKIDRRGLPDPQDERPALEAAFQAPTSAIEQQIAAVWAEVLGLETVGIHDNFFELGGNSMLIVQVHARLKKTFGDRLALVELFAQPSISALAQWLAKADSPAEESNPGKVLTGKDVFTDTRVAVIGLAGRFTGSNNLEEFWQHILNSRETIRVFTEEELLTAGIDPEIIAMPNFVPVKGVLDGADLFDAGLFDMPPREAELLDPQHRIFFEHAWMALEHAGYDPNQYPGAIGVYAGSSPNYYYRENLLGNPNLDEMDMFKVEFGNYSDFMPERTSYLLNLRGASVNIQSACSTSLTAIAEAYYGILNGECDMALAGGSTVLFPQVSGYFYHESGIWSKDGHCKAFDQDASGLVVGEGVGVVMLKPFAKALEDGDTIHAVICGAAIKNEGSAKVGFAAPGVEGQSLMVQHAIEMANLNPRTIGMVEAHGSATNLGDPAEVAALTRAWRRYTDDQTFCAIGSVKTNVGHADIAAGVAGFLKATLALRDGVIPPSLHFKEPNPQLEMETSPFYVPTQVKPWKETTHPRRAAVSSLGVGGTNTHIILEQAPEPQASTASQGPHLFVFSAKTPTALRQHLANMRQHFLANPQLNPADVAFTLQVGRQALPHRKVLVASNLAEVAEILGDEQSRRSFEQQLSKADLKQPRRVVFMFSGQGSQYAEMGRGLYDTCPVFKVHMDRAFDVMEKALDLDPRKLFFPEPEQLDWANSQLAKTQYTQPFLFSVAYAMARQWMAWGVHADGLLGHSLGEYVAACLAGVMSFADALRLVCRRGALNASLPEGAMTAVSLPEADLQPMLNAHISIAAVNSPHACVVSGTPEAVAALEAACDKQFVDYRRLAVSNAFHSITQEPIREAFRAAVAAIELKAPRRPFWSCLTGELIRAEQATDPEYWVDQMMHAVRFSAAVKAEMGHKQATCLLEVGPGRTLVTLARQQLDRKRPALLLTSMRHPKEKTPDQEHLLTTLGRLWLGGNTPEWETLYQGQRRQRQVLPFYPFERKRYFVEPAHLEGQEEAARNANPLFKNPNIDQWFYIPSWTRTAFPTPPPTNEPAKTWLFLVDDRGIGLRMAQQLRAADHQVILVRPGSGFAETGYARYSVDPEMPSDFQTLFEELADTGLTPDIVVHAWSMNNELYSSAETDPSLRQRILSLGAAIHLAGGLGLLGGNRQPLLYALTDQSHEITGEETLNPEQAGMVGFSRVLAQEYNLFCRCIDVEVPQTETESDALAARLIVECQTPTDDTVIAYRQRFRVVEAFEPVQMPEKTRKATRLRQGGVYLMTGGLGYLGFELGAQLAQNYQAKLALVGHRPLPPRQDWDAYLTENGHKDDKTVWKIRWAQRLEAMGAEVLLLHGDVTDLSAMQGVFQQVEAHFGPLNGVFHAAGITDESHYHPIKETSLENLWFQFAPKITGLKVLETLLRDRQVDFCLNFSSIAAVLGGLGFVGYSAANNILDAYSYQLNRDHETHWVSVNWDGWLLEDLLEAAKASEPDSLLALAMTLPEGLQVIERILAHPDLTQVVMSSGRLDLRIDRWVKLKSLKTKVSETQDVSGSATSEPGHDRPALSNAFVEPSNEIEKNIALIWQELLGVRGVGIHDNFFELGGDSLLSVHLSTKITASLGVQIPGGALLALQTVAEQADAVVEKLASQLDAETAAQVLGE